MFKIIKGVKILSVRELVFIFEVQVKSEPSMGEFEIVLVLHVLHECLEFSK